MKSVIKDQVYRSLKKQLKAKKVPYRTTNKKAQKYEYNKTMTCATFYDKFWLERTDGDSKS